MNVKLLDRAAELGWRRLEEGEEGEQCTAKSMADSMRTGLPLSGAGFARKLHQIWYVIIVLSLSQTHTHTNTHTHTQTHTQTHTLHEYCICRLQAVWLSMEYRYCSILFGSSLILFTAKTGKSRCGWLPCSVTKATTQAMQLPQPTNSTSGFVQAAQEVVLHSQHLHKVQQQTIDNLQTNTVTM